MSAAGTVIAADAVDGVIGAHAADAVIAVGTVIAADGVIAADAVIAVIAVIVSFGPRPCRRVPCRAA